MSSEFRLPLPGKLGPGMSATIPNFRPPKCSKFGEEKLFEISDRLMTLVQDEKTDTKLIEKKKTKQQIVEQQRLMSAIYPQTSTSKGNSFWHLFKVPLDAKFSETYVSSGIGKSGEEDEEKSNIASFVRKTKELLLNEEVLKEVDVAAPGDQVQVIEPKVGRKKLKKMKQAEREKTKGEGWFNMKAPEMTPELQNELDVLRMRSAIDPTRFYKKLDSSAPPKYFQIGHVLDSPVDFYSDRIAKKDRKKTLVDELLADAEFKKFSKRKYVEIIDEKSKYQRNKRFKHSGKGKKSTKATAK